MSTGTSPEIEQNLTRRRASGCRLSFTPTLVPMARGILATVTAPARRGVDAAEVEARVAGRVRRRGVRPPARPTGSGRARPHVLGSNAAHVQVTVDERAGRVVAVCAIDNLGKGAAGAAVQCLNLALGLPETTGLTAIGVAP